MRKIYLAVLGVSICLSNALAENNEKLIPLTWKSKEDSLKICEMKRNAGLLQMGEQIGQNDFKNSDLFYEAGKGWTITTVDTLGRSGEDGTAISLDSQDNPHIAYSRQGDKIMYASWNDSSSLWKFDNLLGGANFSLDIDSANYPHISCFFNGLGYLVKSDSGWDTVQPYPGPWVDWTSIAFDSKGRPHIGWAWSAWLNAELILYTYLDDTTWKTESVDTVMGASSGTVGEISIALDSADSPHLAYSTNGPAIRFRYAKKVLGVWEKEMPDTTTPDSSVVGYWADCCPVVKIDRFGKVNISYSRWLSFTGGYNYELRFATKEGNSWKVEKIDTLNANGKNNLIINSDNNPHIAYGCSGWLKYARCSTGVWYEERIDTVCGIGNCGLAIDKDGVSHISYCKEFSTASPEPMLKYAKGHPVGIEEDDMKKQIGITLNIYPTIIYNNKIKLEYKLAQEKEVNISIHNLAGQKVVTLVNGKKKKGEYTNFWMSRSLKNGTYFCCLKTEGELLSKKLIIINRR